MVICLVQDIKNFQTVDKSSDQLVTCALTQPMKMCGGGPERYLLVTLPNILKCSETSLTCE